MKTRWKILIGLLLVLTVGIVYGVREFTRGNKDLADAKPDVSIAATQLLSEYAANETVANKKYLNKVISVRGVLKSVDKDSAGMVTLSLDAGDPIAAVSCQLDTKHIDESAAVKSGDSVTVVGMCTGMLTDVVLVRSALEINPKK
jgi:hypothetical protein